MDAATLYMIITLADGAVRTEQEAYVTVEDCQDRAKREWTFRENFAWCRRDKDGSRRRTRGTVCGGATFYAISQLHSP